MYFEIDTIENTFVHDMEIFSWSLKEKVLLGMVILSQLLILGFLPLSPLGFYIDEVAGATHVMCLQQTGFDFYNASFSLFFQSLGGGYTTAVYAYLQVVWTSVFGTSPEGFRSFSWFLGVLTVSGVYAFIQYYFSRFIALVGVLFISVTPWFFVATHLAWDPPLVLPFLVWGVVVFLCFSPSLKTSLLAGVLFSLALFSYPPTKVQLFLLIPVLFFYQYGWNLKKAIQEQFPFIVVFSASVAALLAFYFLHPEALARSEMLSIFAPVYWEHFRNPITERTFFGIFETFWINFFAYFTPDFLFFSGDSNLRHSSGFAGMWGVFESIFVLCVPFLFVSPRSVISLAEKKILLFLCFAYFSGIVPAALTWEGTPHSLRSIGSVPFLLFLSVFSFGILFRNFFKTTIFFLLCSLIFSVFFLIDFFTVYPQRSQIFFDENIVVSAEIAKKNNDFSLFLIALTQKKYDPLATSYFLMQYADIPCEKIRK